MRKTFIDNAIKIWEKHGKWFVWNFVEELPEICNNKVFVKYAKHKKWEERVDQKLEKDHVTVVVLIKWKYQIQFPDENKKYIMKKEWDMVYFANNVNHLWKAITDCLLIVISWKK